MSRLDPQCWRIDAEGEARNLIAEAEQAFDEGDIDAAELDRRLEFIAELEAEALS